MNNHAFSLLIVALVAVVGLIGFLVVWIVCRPRKRRYYPRDYHGTHRDCLLCVAYDDKTGWCKEGFGKCSYTRRAEKTPLTSIKR